MPTYDYVCEACGREFEHVQSIKSGALRKCPECKEYGLKRLIGTGGGIIFKGSGFYETDYRSSAYQDAKKKDSGGDNSTAKKSTSDDGAGSKKQTPPPDSGSDGSSKA